MLDETYLGSGIKQIHSSQGKEVLLRKRIHTLISDNFQLKEKLEVAEKDLKTSQQQRHQLREQIRLLLQQVTLNDKTIDSIKQAHSQRQTQLCMFEQQIKGLKEQLRQQNEISSKLIQHNHNLQTEIQLITEIKHQYSLQLSKLRLEFQSNKIQMDKIAVQNQWLQNQLTRQQEWTSNLQSQICARRNDIEQYEKFVLDRLSSARNNQQFHSDCKAELSRLSHKYSKYKAKSTSYRRQRDHLLQQLDILARELDAPGQG